MNRQPKPRPAVRRPLRLIAPLPRPFIPLFLLLLLYGRPAEGQEMPRLEVSDTLWEVHLAAGESYVGRMVAVSGDTITLETVTGTRIEFVEEQAERVRPARGTVHGNTFWREDPNVTRLFFSPTARTLDAGDGYLGVYEVILPFVAYGVTDRLLLAGGSPFYLALTGEIKPPLYLGPKLQVIDSETFQASVGALAVLVPDDTDVDNLGILYGVGTWGTSDRALSAGAGWGYVDDKISSVPVIMVGGETRIGRYTKLISENLFVPGEEGVIVTAGIRFFGERLSADAGLGTMVGIEDTAWIPLVNFVYNFGPAR